MKRLDLIIDALEEIQASGLLKEQPWSKWVQALAAARELRDMKPSAWWQKDPDTGNWFLATWFDEHAETEPLYALDEVKE